ncbi:hypothetical protein, partial [Cupriavidus sp. UYPR2.512]|uniref:hypothetical protein n=1 Tax=Cupriavidus sp. UYPR2.512 TaxID=1080187 RepID=UPI001E4FB116
DGFRKRRILPGKGEYAGTAENSGILHCEIFGQSATLPAANYRTVRSDAELLQKELDITCRLLIGLSEPSTRSP